MLSVDLRIIVLNPLNMLDMLGYLYTNRLTIRLQPQAVQSIDGSFFAWLGHMGHPFSVLATKKQSPPLNVRLTLQAVTRPS
jgi:hypothetical protein